MTKNLEQIETASLVLYTSQASTSANFNTVWTWNNINLRSIIGDDMYNKYNTFNLVLHIIAASSTSVAFNTAALTAVTIDDRNVLIAMTGPAWKNKSYVYSSQTNTGTSIMGNFQIGVGAAGGIGAPQSTIYPQININTFSKESSSWTAGISLKRIIPNATTLSYDTAGVTNGIQQTFPNFVFIFDIIGSQIAKDYLMDINGRKLY